MHRFGAQFVVVIEAEHYDEAWNRAKSLQEAIERAIGRDAILIDIEPEEEGA